jgi:hypothetical protein
MRRFVVTVEPDTEPGGRLALILDTEPALADGGALGALYLPLAWVQVLKALEPAVRVLADDVEIVWQGVAVEAPTIRGLPQAARLLRKAIRLLT